MLLALLVACGPDTTEWSGVSPHSSDPPTKIEIALAQPTAPLVQTVEVTASEDAPLELVCTDANGEGDEIVVSGDAAAEKTQRLTLAGLLADTPYTCTVSSGETKVGFDFATTPLREPPPEMILGGAGPADGYTILYHLTWDEKGWSSNYSGIYIVDPLARVRWYYDMGNTNIDLDAHVLDAERVLYGGALFTVPTVVGIDHEPILAFDTDEKFHHQVEPLSDNRILTLTEIENTDGTDTWIGFLVSVRDLSTQEILWSWSSQTAVDAGVLPGPITDLDVYHANSAQLLEGESEPHLMLVSLRNLERVLAIDTDTGDVAWTLGRGGDFTLVDTKGTALPDEQWFEGQHAIEAHWPRILMFDNGPYELRSDGTSSRALELEIDTGAMTATQTWTYADSSVHEALGGDANRLASGNVLMTSPHCFPCDVSDEHSTIVEVTPEGEVAWRIDFGDERSLLYRAERIDPCSLFSNRAYCPSL